MQKQLLVQTALGQIKARFRWQLELITHQWSDIKEKSHYLSVTTVWRISMLTCVIDVRICYTKTNRFEVLFLVKDSIIWWISVKFECFRISSLRLTCSQCLECRSTSEHSYFCRFCPADYFFFNQLQCLFI